MRSERGTPSGHQVRNTILPTSTQKLERKVRPLPDHNHTSILRTIPPLNTQIRRSKTVTIRGPQGNRATQGLYRTILHPGMLSDSKLRPHRSYLHHRRSPRNQHYQVLDRVVPRHSRLLYQALHARATDKHRQSTRSAPPQHGPRV